MGVSFKWKSCCFLCTKLADGRNSTVIQIRTLPLQNKLLNQCKSKADEWGREVLGRLSSCNDLVAEDPVYHIPCMNKFRLKSIDWK